MLPAFPELFPAYRLQRSPLLYYLPLTQNGSHSYDASPSLTSSCFASADTSTRHTTPTNKPSFTSTSSRVAGGTSVVNRMLPWLRPPGESSPVRSPILSMARFYSLLNHIALQKRTHVDTLSLIYLYSLISTFSTSLYPAVFATSAELYADIFHWPVTPHFRANGFAILIDPNHDSPDSLYKTASRIPAPLVFRAFYELYGKRTVSLLKTVRFPSPR